MKVFCVFDWHEEKLIRVFKEEKDADRFAYEFGRLEGCVRLENYYVQEWEVE